jgi:hypothetical protein
MNSRALGSLAGCAYNYGVLSSVGVSAEVKPS